ncbi:MAG: outer membrane beta-barrel protein [Gemmatimonadetes bacterium]|nr:outer membrane beta-barrel protein [Gemmatimonadota bacterium]
MTRFRSYALALVAVLFATPVLAQTGSGRWMRVEANPYVGAFVLDDSELEEAGLEADIGPILGGRVGVTLGDDWLIEGSYGYASVSLEESEFTGGPVEEFENDLGVHLVHGSIGYLIGTDVAPTKLVLTAGTGVMWVDPEVGESDADFLVGLGAGFTHPVNEWIAFKGDFRDHITFCSAPERVDDFSVCSEDEALNNFEISGGLQFFLY